MQMMQIVKLDADNDSAAMKAAVARLDGSAIEICEIILDRGSEALRLDYRISSRRISFKTRDRPAPRWKLRTGSAASAIGRVILLERSVKKAAQAGHLPRWKPKSERARGLLFAAPGGSLGASES